VHGQGFRFLPTCWTFERWGGRQRQSRQWGPVESKLLLAEETETADLCASFGSSSHGAVCIGPVVHTPIDFACQYNSVRAKTLGE